ncbi:TPR repeat protein [Paraburkholderia sp. MM5477-R1]
MRPADGHLRGMAAAALADSARLGRGMPVDTSRALTLYEQAITLGHKASGYNLGLYWEGAVGCRREERYPGPHEGYTELSARRG